jgi:hypothetical protein
MATRNRFVDSDFAKNELQNLIIEPLTTAEITTKAQVLTADDKGLIIYDVDANRLLVWTGSIFSQGLPAIFQNIDLLDNGVLTKTGTTIVTIPTGTAVGNIPLVQANGLLDPAIIPNVFVKKSFQTNFAQSNVRTITQAETIVAAYRVTGITVIDLIPTFTANNAPPPWQVSSPNILSFGNLYKVFDKVNIDNNFDLLPASTETGTVTITVGGSSFIASGISASFYDDVVFAPSTMLIQGSLDGIVFNDIVFFPNTKANPFVAQFDNTNSYLFYRLIMTNSVSTIISIREITLGTATSTYKLEPLSNFTINKTGTTFTITKTSAGTNIFLFYYL